MKVVEIDKPKKFGKIRTSVMFSIDPTVVMADPSVQEVLGQFDCDVANVCISEWEAGNRYITYSMIYRGLTGKVGDSDATPSKVQLAKIKHSLKKLMNVQIDLDLKDLCEKLGYNEGKAIRIVDKIIPARFVDKTINGQKTTVIELMAESPLLKVAKLKNNQILTCDIALLNVPKQKNTPLNIELKHYALRRVLEIIAHHQMTPTLTFADVFEKCRIASADNKKKHRVREFLKSFFEHLENCGLITSFEVTKKAGVFYSIEFTFGNMKRKSKVKQLAKKEQNSKEPPLLKEVEPKTIEKLVEEKKEEWIPSAMSILPWLHRQYSHYALTVPPWCIDFSALLKALQIPTFFLF